MWKSFYPPKIANIEVIDNLQLLASCHKGTNITKGKMTVVYFQKLFSNPEFQITIRKDAI
jgi:hypothetical protein